MSNGPVVEEVATRLTAGGVALFEWRCTPADLPALAVGRLYIEGLIADAGIASDLAVEDTGPEIEITVRRLPPPMHVERVPQQTALPGPEQFGDLFRALFAAVDARHESGGVHAAALATSGEIAFQAEDVGRHNAVDKVIGMALLGRADPEQYGLLVSSRISGEIARKAAGAGVLWLASRSIPTTLAVQVAREAGLRIIGRAAGKGAFVYE